MIVVLAAGDVIHEGAHLADAELDRVFRETRQRDRAASLTLSVEPAVPAKRKLALLARARRAGFTKIATVAPIVTTVPDRKPAPVGSALVLGLGARGAVTVAGAPVEAAALDGVLRAAHAKAPDTRIVIAVGGDVAYGLVVDLMDRVKAIGFTDIALSSP